jgi:ABC-2 type transport system permease protein
MKPHPDHPLTPSLASNLRALYTIAERLEAVLALPAQRGRLCLQPLIWLTPVFFMGQAFSVNGQAQGFAAYSGHQRLHLLRPAGHGALNFINSVFWGIGYALKSDMDAGVLESTWLTPTARPILLIGRTITNLFTTVIISAIMLAIAALLFGFRPPAARCWRWCRCCPC